MQQLQSINKTKRRPLALISGTNDTPEQIVIVKWLTIFCQKAQNFE